MTNPVVQQVVDAARERDRQRAPDSSYPIMWYRSYNKRNWLVITDLICVDLIEFEGTGNGG